MKHNYPKIRKPRSTDYAVSTQLVKHFGLEYVYEIWAEHGMYKASKLLTEQFGAYVSPYVLRAMSNKYDWQRVITDTSLPIAKAVIRGSVPDGYYKHLIIKHNVLSTIPLRI